MSRDGGGSNRGIILTTGADPMRIVTIVTALVVLALTPASGQTPKRGGILNAMQAEDLPAGFSIHDRGARDRGHAVGVQ